MRDVSGELHGGSCAPDVAERRDRDHAVDAPECVSGASRVRGDGQGTDLAPIPLRLQQAIAAEVGARLVPSHEEAALERIATGSARQIVLSPREYALLEDELAPPLDSNNGKRWLTKAQRRQLARVLSADRTESEDPLPPRAVRRQQMAEHGAPALGVSKREAWTLYQLTKGQ